jgi:hypothetical protein
VAFLLAWRLSRCEQCRSTTVTRSLQVGLPRKQFYLWRWKLQTHGFVHAGLEGAAGNGVANRSRRGFANDPAAPSTHAHVRGAGWVEKTASGGIGGSSGSAVLHLRPGGTRSVASAPWRDVRRRVRKSANRGWQSRPRRSVALDQPPDRLHHRGPVGRKGEGRRTRRYRSPRAGTSFFRTG